MKTGLVLEGGAMRGMYTAGALDVLLENDINFDGIIGTSAGAVFGVNFLSRQDGRVIRYNCRFNGDRNYMGIKPLLKNGDIFNTEKSPFVIHGIGTCLVHNHKQLLAKLFFIAGFYPF